MQERKGWTFVHNTAEGAEWTPGLREISNTAISPSRVGPTVILSPM